LSRLTRLTCLPFSQHIQFPVTPADNAKSRDSKKQQFRHLTSQDNIRNTSESRRLKTEKKDTTEERNEKNKAKRHRGRIFQVDDLNYDSEESEQVDDDDVNGNDVPYVFFK
jgi:hypothetical protein